jgi:hypothetical protein
VLQLRIWNQTADLAQRVYNVPLTAVWIEEIQFSFHRFGVKTSALRGEEGELKLEGGFDMYRSGFDVTANSNLFYLM